MCSSNILKHVNHLHSQALILAQCASTSYFLIVDFQFVVVHLVVSRFSVLNNQRVREPLRGSSIYV